MITLLIIGGLALILLGANALVEGSSNIARKLGISEFIIGLTIVGIGTSAPEMVVSFISAAKGNADMAVGNIVGSNIFNILIILGLTALIRPLRIGTDNLKRDVAATIASSALLFIPFVLLYTGSIDSAIIPRWMGIAFLALFAFYMYMCLRTDNRSEQDKGQEVKDSEMNRLKTIMVHPATSVLMILGGLAALIFGGRFFVDGASMLARELGLSDAIIAITIMAGGTSLPELATCIVAAFKKKGDLALGNVLGSNTANILLILGGSAVITPLNMQSISIVDISMVMLSAVFVAISFFTFKKSHLDRVEGFIFIITYTLYMAWLISVQGNL